jgi:phage transcriptional activator, RinA family
MTETKLDTAVFKYIEHELYDYPSTKQAIRRLREEIMCGEAITDENIGGGRSSEPGRPTERIATRLLTNRRLRNLEEVTEAVEQALDQVPEDCRRVINEKYWSHKRLDWQGIADACYVHRVTAIKYRKQFVNLVAEKLAIS